MRDPRFDDISGEFKPESFSQTYKFISDIRQREEEVCLDLQESCTFVYSTASTCFFVPLIFADGEKKAEERKIGCKKRRIEIFSEENGKLAVNSFLANPVYALNFVSIII